MRPRRFGKTFFQTLPRAYYDRAASADFERNFQGTYIAGTPTEERNALYVLLINCHCPDCGCRFKESLATLWRRAFLAFERYYPGSIPAELICFSPNAQCPVGDYLTKCLDSLSDAIRSRLWLLIDDYDAGVRAIERQSDNAEEKRAEWAAMLEVIRNTTATGDLRRVFIITTGTPNGREGLDFAKDIPQDPVFSDIMGFTERELRDLIQRAPLTSNAAVPQRKPCGTAIGRDR